MTAPRRCTCGGNPHDPCNYCLWDEDEARAREADKADDERDEDVLAGRVDEGGV